MFRNAPWSCLVDAILSATILVASSSASKTYEGEVMTASEGSLMMATQSAEVIIEVPQAAIIRLDGQPAGLGDLLPGFDVVVAAEEREARLVASMVTASSGGVSEFGD
jgi:CRISPR/Cas system-associated exonuclease Cas4 (RecB family)